MKKQSFRTLARSAALIAAGSAIFALAFNIFLQPAHINGGGVSGLGQLLTSLTGFGSVAVWSVILNVPLFLLGLRSICRSFFFGSLAGMLISSLALSLTEEWEKLDNGSAMLTGVVVARKSFIEEHSAKVEEFLADYAASVEWVNANTADAASLVGGYGIVAAPVANKALPYCNIVCVTGEEMHGMLSGYLAALAEQAPQAVGGQLPGDDFYYGI